MTGDPAKEQLDEVEEPVVEEADYEVIDEEAKTSS